ncbi:MAG: hypothetical protein ABEJ82_05755 [Haloplanus sp.]
MSNEVDTRVSVSTPDVRVEKRFEADRFPVPAIAFEIESLADDPVDVRLVDHVPESFSMEGIGFHPDYDSDDWTAYRDHRVEYEHTLEPGETILTVYGIRIDDPSEAESFLGEPSIEVMDGSEEEDRSSDVLGRETTQVVRDALSGGGDLSADDAAVLDGTEDAETEGEDGAETEAAEAVTEAEEEEAADAEEGEAAEAEADAEEGEAADAEAEEDEDAGPTPSSEVARALDPRTVEDETADGTVAEAAELSVASVLAAEIRAGEVDDEDLAVLRDELDAAASVPRSVDVRIERLQTQTEDLLAYRDALADFLDENGTAEELTEEMRGDVADLTEQVAAIDESVSAMEARIDDVDERIDDVDERLDDVEAELDGEVAKLRAEMEEVNEELDDLRTFRDRLSDAFGTE